MSTNHTPGPWIPHNGPCVFVVTTTTKPRTFRICTINTDRAEAEANARLIAAAPDLLAVLKETLVDYRACGMEERQIISVIRAAIAKATGGA